jgi:AraC family transcriptional regulator
MRSSTQEDYGNRVRRVLDHIRDGLDRNPSLEELAEVAGFSPYHFHRVFSGTVGESLSGLVRRLRLERAAYRLLNGDEPVIAVAVGAGYSSGGAFTRAFTRAFGETPSEFRRQRLSVPCIPSPSGYHFSPENGCSRLRLPWKGVGAMEARIVDLEPIGVLSVEHRGPYHEIGEAFEELGRFCGRAGLDLQGAQWLAIYRDDPDARPPEDLRSEACVSLAEGTSVSPEGRVRRAEIPGGSYATTRMEGPYSGLHEAWTTLVGRWVPENGYRPREAPCFEVYVRGCADTEDPGEFITDLFEPVEPQ